MGTGCGMYPSIQEACDKFIMEKETTPWCEADSRAYEPFHRIYDKMYLSLRENFTELAQIG